jgi:hypothetical protein
MPEGSTTPDLEEALDEALRLSTATVLELA